MRPGDKEVPHWVFCLFAAPARVPMVGPSMCSARLPSGSPTWTPAWKACVGVGACGVGVGACGLGIGACGVDACVGSALLPPKPIAMPAIPAKPVKPAAAKPGLAFMPSHAVPTPFRTQLIQPSAASILDVDVVDDSDDSDEIIEIHSGSPDYPAPQPDQNGPANARPGPANQSIERSIRRMNRTVEKRKADRRSQRG